MQPGRRVAVALAVSGACATSGQVILLRELLAIFHGNELSLGAVLAGWLLWGAVGSWCIGARADCFRQPAVVMAVLLGVAALLLPATVLGSALCKGALGAAPTETLGLFESLPAVLILLAPLCVTMGGLFAIGARILDQLTPARNAVSHAYLLESTGAGCGGVIVTLVLLPHWRPLGLACLLAAVLLTTALLLLASATLTGGQRLAARLGLAALALVSFLAATDGATAYTGAGSVCLKPRVPGSAALRPWH